MSGFIGAVALIIIIICAALIGDAIRQKQWDHVFCGAMIAIFAVVILLTAIFPNTSGIANNTSEVCRSCDIVVASNFCPGCGADMSAKVLCLGCDKEFYKASAPVYCPDCGEKIFDN